MSKCLSTDSRAARKSRIERGDNDETEQYDHIEQPVYGERCQRAGKWYWSFARQCIRERDLTRSRRTEVVHHSSDCDRPPQWCEWKSRRDRLENDAPSNRAQRKNQRRRNR